MKLCAYYTCGFPSVESSEKIFREISEIADYIEIGIPFSDPIADGPTIQFASQKALERGFRVQHAFQLVRELTKDFPSKKYILMTYYNIVVQTKDFLQRAKRAGIWGIAVPDLPPGEEPEFEREAERLGIRTIFFISPTTPRNRMKFISARTTGFIYYISVKGVTGEREQLPEKLKAELKNIKNLTRKEVFVGFGISDPKHAVELKGYADGIIVGSAIIRRVIQGKDLDDAILEIRKFLSEMRHSLSSSEDRLSDR